MVVTHRRSHITEPELAADDARLARNVLVVLVLGFVVIMGWIEFYDWWNGWDQRSTAELRLAAWAEREGFPVAWSMCHDDMADAAGMVPCSARFTGARPGTWTVYCPGDRSAETRCRWSR